MELVGYTKMAALGNINSFVVTMYTSIRFSYNRLRPLRRCSFKRKTATDCELLETRRLYVTVIHDKTDHIATTITVVLPNPLHQNPH